MLRAPKPHSLLAVPRKGAGLFVSRTRNKGILDDQDRTLTPARETTRPSVVSSWTNRSSPAGSRIQLDQASADVPASLLEIRCGLE